MRLHHSRRSTLLQLLPTLTLLLALPTTISARSKSPPNPKAALLSTIRSLTLRTGHDTAHRRVPAIPQTSCTGGTAAGLYEPDLIRCTNEGASYGGAEDVQWSCTAQLPVEFRLGATDVLCEGWASAEDEWILKGSCAVEYRLELTKAGEERYPERIAAGRGRAGSAGGGPGDRKEGRGWFERVIFPMIFVGVFLWIVGSAVLAAWRGEGGRRGVQAGGNPRPPWGGGGGGWGGGGWGPGGGGGGGNDPPPPYSRYDDGSRKTSTRQQGSNARFQPGFWTGAAAGAATTYLANSLRSGDGRRSNDSGAGSSGWTARSQRDSGSSSTSSSGGGGAGFSGSRHESTGFGGTRRR